MAGGSQKNDFEPESPAEAWISSSLKNPYLLTPLTTSRLLFWPKTSAETGGLTHLERCGANFDVSLQAASRGGAVWLTHWAGEAGDPWLRLKNGFAQDDNRFETVKLNHYPAFTRVESCRALKL